MIKLTGLDSSKEILVYPTHKKTFYAIIAGKAYDGFHPITVKDIDYRIMKKNIEWFIKSAKAKPTHTFWVIGFEPAIDFAPMFCEAPYNCVLPSKWADIIGVDENRKWWNG